jgi:hypothetical protein
MLIPFACGFGSCFSKVPLSNQRPIDGQKAPGIAQHSYQSRFPVLRKQHYSTFVVCLNEIYCDWEDDISGAYGGLLRGVN